MRAVIQRVSSASVTVDGKVVGAVEGPGLLVLLGVTHDDGRRDVEWIARKVWQTRLFEERELSTTDDSFAIHPYGEKKPVGVISLMNVSEANLSADPRTIGLTRAVYEAIGEPDLAPEIPSGPTMFAP